MCAVNPCFVINAPENYSTPLPAQQQGQIYRKLLLAAWRDKAGDIKTSILACGIVQPGVDNAIIYLGIQYLRKCALGTPWIFVILAIWTSTWIIFLSCTSPNKRGFQSYNKRRFSFKGSYLGFIALKEIQIRFATVPILNREGVMEGGRGVVHAVAPSGHKMEAEVFSWRHAAFTCRRRNFACSNFACFDHKVLTNHYKSNHIITVSPPPNFCRQSGKLAR